MTHPSQMEAVSKNLKTKSDKIRALSDAGFERADIARFLGIRYQHVRNVLKQAELKKGKLPAQESGSDSSTGRDGIRNRLRLKLDSSGRILLPPGVRDAMHIGANDNVLAWLENGELRLVNPRIALKHVQKLARELLAGDDSLADDLIAERRQAARKEAKDG